MNFKMKSFLGQAALEELNEQAAETTQTTAPAADTSTAEENTTAGSTEPAPAAAAPAGAEDAVTPAEDGAAAAAGSDTDADATAPADAVDAADADTQAAAAAVDAVDDVDEPAIGDDTEGGDAAAEIQEEMSEVDEAAGNIDDAADDVETLQAAAESLNITVDILQSSMQRGGLDPFGAMLLRQNLRAACESIGQPGDAILLPAMEDAETPSSRMGMAGDAIDAVKKFLARIAKAIADGFKRFGEWISTIWTRLFDANAKLKARAEKLKELLKGAEMATEVTSGSVIRGMNASGVIEKPVEYLSEIERGVMMLCDASTYDGYLRALNIIESGVKSDKSEDEIAVEVDKELEKFAANFYSNSKKIWLLGREIMLRSGGAKASGGDMHGIVLPGNRMLTIFVPQNLKQIGGLSGTAAHITSFSNKQPESIPALSQKEAVEVCDKVINLCNWFTQNEKNTGKSTKAFNDNVKKHTDQIMVYVNAAIDARGKENGPVQDTKVRAVGNWITRMSYSVPKLPCYAFARAVPGSMANYLDLVAASIAKKGNGKDGEPAAAKQLKNAA